MPEENQNLEQAEQNPIISQPAGDVVVKKMLPQNKLVLFLIIVGVAVALYAVTASSQGWWPFGARNGIFSGPKTSLTPIPSPAPTPFNETAGWQTYRHAEGYGFEFKYPAGFSFEANPSGLVTSFSKDKQSGFAFDLVYLLEFQEKISALVSDPDYGARTKQSGIEEKLGLVLLRNRLGTEIYGDFDPPWGYYIVYIKLLNQNNYGVSGIALRGRIPNADTLQRGEEEDLRLFSQILSTFKFTR